MIGERGKVIDQSLKRKFPPGATIFLEGEPGDAAYLIESGRIEISMLKQGEQKVVAVLGPGDVFGEMAIIDDGPRLGTAVVAEVAEVLTISREYVQQKLEETDPLMKLFMQTTLERLRDLEKRTNIGRTSAAYHEHQEQVLVRLLFHQDLLQGFEK